MLENKKSELLEIAHRWYKGESSEDDISDLDFDALEQDILKEDPDWDYRSLLDTQGDTVRHHLTMDKVKKEQELELSMSEVMENALALNVFSAPKYDGSGLCLYYRDGVLYDAITRSSQLQGKSQLRKVSSMVPRFLEDKDIIAIECEVIVDLKHGLGDSSRGKANGLVNSNSMQSECEDLLTIVALKVRYRIPMTTSEMVRRMRLLPEVRVRDNTTFISTPFSSGRYEGTKFYDKSVSSLIDGLVEYFDEGSIRYGYLLAHKKIKAGMTEFAHKIYYNEKKESTIIDIEWNLHPSSLKYVPKYVYDEVVVDGTKCARANVGGTAQLQKMQCGTGARVEIIKAGLTIPQVFRPVSEVGMIHNLFRLVEELTTDEVDSLVERISLIAEDTKGVSLVECNAKDNSSIEMITESNNYVNKTLVNNLSYMIGEDFKDVKKFTTVGFYTSEDYNLPVTCDCGEKMTLDHELNGGLYCPNVNCSVVKEALEGVIEESGLSIQDFVTHQPVKFISDILKCPRFSGEDKLSDNTSQLLSSSVDAKGKCHNVYKKKTLTDYSNDLLEKKDSLAVTLSYFDLSKLQREVISKFSTIVDSLL